MAIRTSKKAFTPQKQIAKSKRFFSVFSAHFPAKKRALQAPGISESVLKVLVCSPKMRRMRSPLAPPARAGAAHPATLENVAYAQQENVAYAQQENVAYAQQENVAYAQ